MNSRHCQCRNRGLSYSSVTYCDIAQEACHTEMAKKANPSNITVYYLFITRLLRAYMVGLPCTCLPSLCRAQPCLHKAPRLDKTRL